MATPECATKRMVDPLAKRQALMCDACPAGHFSGRGDCPDLLKADAESYRLVSCRLAKEVELPDCGNVVEL